MEPLAERIVTIVREANAALCIECVAQQIHMNPHVVHPSLSGLALLDEFSYAVECSRCGRSNQGTLIVGPHSLDQKA